MQIRLYMGHKVTKPVFGFSDQVRLKPACSVDCADEQAGLPLCCSHATKSGFLGSRPISTRFPSLLIDSKQASIWVLLNVYCILLFSLKVIQCGYTCILHLTDNLFIRRVNTFIFVQLKPIFLFFGSTVDPDQLASNKTI